VDVEVNVKGMKELEARLSEMDALAGQKLLTRVLRKVAKPMADRARQNASSIGRSQSLALSIGIINRKTNGSRYTRSNVVAAVAVGSIAKSRIAVTRYNQYYGKSGIYRRKGIFYGWMLDQGHRVGTKSTGYLKKGNAGSRAETAKGLARWAAKAEGGRLKSLNRSTGATSVAARPWWTPAVNATERPAIDAFVLELRRAVAKVERRTGRTAQPDSLVPQ
jgi:hypothetical protein